MESRYYQIVLNFPNLAFIEVDSDYERKLNEKGIFTFEPRSWNNSLSATKCYFKVKSNRFFFCVRPQRYIQTFKYGNADAEELWDAIGQVGILVTDSAFIRIILLTN